MDDNVSDSDVDKKVDVIQVDTQTDVANGGVVGSEEPTRQTQVVEKCEAGEPEKLVCDTQDNTEMCEDRESDCSLVTYYSDNSPSKKQNLPEVENKPSVILPLDEDGEPGEPTEDNARLAESEPDMFSSQLDSSLVQHESMECEDIIPSSQEEIVEDIASTQILSKGGADDTSRTTPCKRKLENGEESLGKVLCLENHSSPNEARSLASAMESVRVASPDNIKAADSSTEVAPPVEEHDADDVHVKLVEPKTKDIKFIEESENEDNGDTNDIHEDVNKRFKEIVKKEGETVESKDNVPEGDGAKIINTRDSEATLEINNDAQPSLAVNNEVTGIMSESILANGKSQSDIQTLDQIKPQDKPFQLNFSLKMNKIISDNIVLLPSEKPSVSNADNNPQCGVLELGDSKPDVPKYDPNFKSSHSIKFDVADSRDDRCNLSNVDDVTQQKNVSPVSEDLSSDAFKLKDPTTEPSISDMTTKTSKSENVTTKISKSENVTTKTPKSENVTTEASESVDMMTETSKLEDDMTETSKSEDVITETSKSEDVITETSKSDVVIQTSKPDATPKSSKSEDLMGTSISAVSVASKLDNVVTNACLSEDFISSTFNSEVLTYAAKSEDVSDVSKSKDVTLDASKSDDATSFASKSDDVMSDEFKSENVTLNSSELETVMLDVLKSKELSDTSKSDDISGTSKLDSVLSALSKSSKVISSFSLQSDVPGLNDVGSSATKTGNVESNLALPSALSKYGDATIDSSNLDDVTSHPSDATSNGVSEGSNSYDVKSSNSRDFVSCLSKTGKLKSSFSDKVTKYKVSDEVESGFPKFDDVKPDLQKLNEVKSNVQKSGALTSDVYKVNELKSNVCKPISSIKSIVINVDNKGESDVSKSHNVKSLKSFECSSLIEEEPVKSQTQDTKYTVDEQERSSHTPKCSSRSVKHLDQDNFVHPPSKFVRRGNEGDEYNGEGSLISNELDVSDSQDFNLCISLSPNTSTQSADNVSLEKSSSNSQHDDVKDVEITEVVSETVLEKKADEESFKQSTSEKTHVDCNLSNGFADIHNEVMSPPSDNKTFSPDGMDTRDDSISIIYEENNQSPKSKEEPTSPRVKRKRQDDDPEIIEYIDIANETPPQHEDEHHNKKLRTSEKEDTMSLLSSSLLALPGNHSALSDRNDSSFENEAAAQGMTATQYRRITMAVKMKIVYDKHTKDVVSRTVLQCEEIRDDRGHQSCRSSELSSGYMGDCDGKTSPGSVTSTGLYPLPKQMSRLSMASTSSSSTSGTSSFDKSMPFSSSTIMPPPKEVPKERCPSRDDNFEKSDVSPLSSVIRNYDAVIQFLNQVPAVDNLNISDGPYHLNYETKKFESKVCSGSEISSSSDANGHLKDDDEVKRYADKMDALKTSMKTSFSVKRRTPKIKMSVENEVVDVSQSVVDSGVKSVNSGNKESDCDSPAALSSQVGRFTRRARNKRDLEGGKTPVSRNTTPSRTPGSADRKTGAGRRRNGLEKDFLKTQGDDGRKTPESCGQPPEPETPKSESLPSLPRTPEVTDGVHGDIIVPGAPAFARWTDKKYYSGKVKKKVQRDKWQVEFDDGNSKALIEDFIIVCTQLNRGQSVYAMDRHRDFHSGVIRDSKISDGEIIYGVELDDTEEQLLVPRAKIAMSEDQANLLRESAYDRVYTSLTPKQSSSVTLDNLMEGKRPRKLSQLQLERPHSSGTPSSVKPRRAHSDASSASDTADKISSASDCVAGVEPESYPFIDIVSGSHTGKSRRGKSITKSSGKSKAKSLEDPSISSLLGPIPDEGSTIFSGRIYLITCSDIDYHVNTTLKKKTSSGKKGKKSSSDDINEMSSDNLEVGTPFDKHRLKRQLTAGGGTVFENFHDVPENKYSKCKLIANKVLRTAKYLLCLAHSIPIVHHTWVIDSVKKGSDEDSTNYHLHAGWSLEDNMYKDWKKESSRSSKKLPLQGLLVYIVNEAGIFFKFWHKILTALGASATHLIDTQDLATMKPDVILTDLSCFEEVVREAEVHKIPLVSTTWVVQCLINWRRCGYNAHVKYRYNAPD